MNEDKVIEQIARPIIEQLKKLDNSEIQKKWNQIPKIHFVRDDGMEGPLVIDGVEINDEFIEKADFEKALKDGDEVEFLYFMGGGR